MLSFGANFKEHYLKNQNKERALLCPLCQRHEHSQQNLIDCEEIDNSLEKITKKEYESLLSEKIDTAILLKFKKLWQQREDRLNL